MLLILEQIQIHSAAWIFQRVHLHDVISSDNWLRFEQEFNNVYLTSKYLCPASRRPCTSLTGTDLINSSAIFSAPLLLPAVAMHLHYIHIYRFRFRQRRRTKNPNRQFNEEWEGEWERPGIEVVGTNKSEQIGESSSWCDNGGCHDDCWCDSFSEMLFGFVGVCLVLFVGAPAAIATACAGSRLK